MVRDVAHGGILRIEGAHEKCHRGSRCVARRPPSRVASARRTMQSRTRSCTDNPASTEPRSRLPFNSWRWRWPSGDCGSGDVPRETVPLVRIGGRRLAEAIAWDGASFDVGQVVVVLHSSLAAFAAHGALFEELAETASANFGE